MGNVTRAILRQRVAEGIGPYITGTATGGSTTTVVDTSRIEPNDKWVNFYVEITSTTDSLAPDGEIRLVTDSDQSSGTLTVSPAFSAAVEANDTYALWVIQPSHLDWCIDLAVRAAAEGWYELKRDTTTLDTAAGTVEYSLPNDVVTLLDVFILLDAASGDRMSAPPWHVEGTPGSQKLIFDHLPPAVYDLGLEYRARPSLASGASATLNVGASAQDVQAEEDCADFIVAYALDRYFARRYNQYGDPQDWDLMRFWHETWPRILEARRMIPPLPEVEQGPTAPSIEQRLESIEQALGQLARRRREWGL